MAKYSDNEVNTCDCTCDNCRDEIVINSANYYHVNDELRDMGWKTRKINGQFVDFCSDECLIEYTNKKK